MPSNRHNGCWLSVLSLSAVAFLTGCDVGAEGPELPRAVLSRTAAVIEPASQPSASAQLSLYLRGAPHERRLDASAGTPVALPSVAMGTAAAGQELSTLAACQPSTWVVQPQVGPGQVLTGVAYGNGLYVAVGYNGEILTSNNGTSWSDLSPTSKPFHYLDVAFGGGAFVAVGADGRIDVLSGPNAGAVSFGTGFVLSHVAYGNGTWVVAGGYLAPSFQWYSLIIASTDGGLSWNAVDLRPASGALSTHRGAAFGNGTFVVTSATGDFLYSSDGTTWLDGGNVPGAWFNFVTFGGGRFLAGSDNGGLYRSYSGVDWTLDATLGSVDWFDGAYHDGVWVVVGESGSIASSSSGGSWTYRSSGTSNQLEAVAGGPGTWVAVGTSDPGNQRIVTASCPTPDLAPFTPSGWSAPLVLSTQPGTSTQSAVITAAQSIYIDVAWGNFGNANAGAFTVGLTLQGSPLGTLSSTGLAALSGQGMTDLVLSPLPAGTYTLTMRVDDGSVVAESNENNNTYSRTFTVVP
jgi:hypothetical protein